MKKREVLMAVLLGGGLALPRAEAVEITGSGEKARANVFEPALAWILERAR